jgi:hypothetical protein
MTGCLGRTLRKPESADRRSVTEGDHSDRASSEGSLGDSVENLQRHDADPQRIVEKMSSGMAKPNYVSSKCILV